MEAPKFDASINLGNIIAIIALVGGLLLIWVKLETSLAVNQVQIQNIEYSVKELNAEVVWMRRTLLRIDRQTNGHAYDPYVPAPPRKPDTYPYNESYN